MSSRVKLPASSSVVPLELHLLCQKIDRRLFVLVNPAIRLRHRFHKTHKQRTVLITPGTLHGQRGELIAGNHIDESADLVESLFLSGIVERQGQRGRINLTGGQRRKGLRGTTDNQEFVVPWVFESFYFQNLPKGEGHTRSQADSTKSRAAQVLVPFEFLGGHNGLRQAIDDAADHDQVQCVFNGGNGRVGGATRDLQRASSQRLNPHVGGAYNNQIDIQSLAVEKAHLGSDPKRSIPKCLGRRTNPQLRSFLGEGR